MNMIADLNALSGEQKDTFIDLRMVSDGDSIGMIDSCAFKYFDLPACLLKVVFQ